MNETGIKTGTMKFHKSCSNISTLSKVIKFISKNDLNILTDHGKNKVIKKNEMAIEKIMRLWFPLDLEDTLLKFFVSMEITSNDIGMSMFRR